MTDSQRWSGRLGRPVTGRRGSQRRLAHLSAVSALVTALMLMVSPGPAQAFDPTLIRPEPDHPLIERTGTPDVVHRQSNEPVAPLHPSPDYAPSVPADGPQRDELNAAADALGSDVESVAEAFGQDEEAQELIRDCTKAALGGIIGDIIGTATNNDSTVTDEDNDQDTDQPFDLGTEILEELVGTGPNLMAKCLNEYTGAPPSVTSRIAHYAFRAVDLASSKALSINPDLTSLVDFLGVANWYSIQN
jgi:hypothetical protein